MDTRKLSRRHFIGTAAATVAAIRTAHGVGLEKRDVAWLKEVQTPPNSLPKNAPKLAPLLVNSQGQAIATQAAWDTKRESIRKWWLDFLQPFRADRHPIPKFEIVEEGKVDGVARQLIRYDVEPGLSVDAYLLKPAKITGKLPGVVAMHSTVDHSIRQPAGVEGKPEKAFGLKLAKKGYVAICPRNFLWPTNHKIVAGPETERFFQRHPKSTGMAKMLYDAQVATDILAALPEVDADRLGCVGHSLGAKEAIYLPAFDSRIKVSVSSEGGVGTKFSNWNAPWYLGERITADDFTREHHELLGLIAPRPFLLLGGDSADGDRSWPFIEAALPVYRLYERTARIGLLNHRQGHAVPPIAEQRIYDWFDTYL